MIDAQLTKLVHDSMNDAGISVYPIEDGGKSDRVSPATIRERATASQLLRERVSGLGIPGLETLEVQDRIVFVDLGKRSPQTLLNKPVGSAEATRFVPWSHVSLNKTVEAVKVAMRHAPESFDVQSEAKHE